MKVSLVITVLNEAHSIQALLSSVSGQAVLPDELVITDAGSVDGTLEYIQSWQKSEKKIKVKLVEIPNANRSRGRNVGIKKSSHDLILLTDAGCVLDPMWVKKLVECYDKYKPVDVIAGFYLPEIASDWMRVFSWYTSVSVEDLNEASFVPSARSVAVTKAAWEKYGRFPEDLDTCEDLVFFERIKEKGTMKLCRDAIAHWEQENSLGSFINQIAGYATGDVRAVHLRHSAKIVSVYARYALFFLLPPLFLLYPLFPLVKFRKKLTHFGLMWRVMVVQLAADVGVMWGALLGILPRRLSA